MPVLTYLALLVADSRKWSDFGADTFDRTSKRFFDANMREQIPASYGHGSFEIETRRVLFWNSPQGLVIGPMPASAVLGTIARREGKKSEHNPQPFERIQ